MTREEKAELLRYVGGAGVVFLDTPEQRSLIRKGFIRIVESPPAIFKAARSFATITDAGAVQALKILGTVGEAIVARGHSGTFGDSLRDKDK